MKYTVNFSFDCMSKKMSRKGRINVISEQTPESLIHDENLISTIRKEMMNKTRSLIFHVNVDKVRLTD